MLKETKNMLQKTQEMLLKLGNAKRYYEKTKKVLEIYGTQILRSITKA